MPQTPGPVGRNDMIAAAVQAAVQAYLLEARKPLLGTEVPFLPGGYESGKPVTYALPPGIDLQHVYATGQTGSGKTNFILNLVKGHLAGGRSLCLIDLRGDLFDRVLRLAAATKKPRWLSERLVLIDLRDEHHVTPFNPLEGPGDAYARALLFQSVVKKDAESWGVQLDETLRNANIALAEAGGTVVDIAPLLTNPPFRAETLASVSDPVVLDFFERYSRLSAAKQETLQGPVLNKVSPFLAVPQLRRMFGSHGALRLDLLFNRIPGAVLLVALGVDRLHEAAYLAGGLLVAALQNAMMSRVDLPSERRIPVMLYVDEFETMATERFNAIVAEGRRFGLGLVLSHQNLSQIPKDLSAVLRNNVQTQLYFRTGAGDAAALAKEIVSDYDPDQIRQALLTQPVGEAFLVRRGYRTVRIKTPRYTDPPVTRAALAGARAAGHARFSRPTAEVDARMQARRERLRAIERGTAPPQRSAGSVGASGDAGDEDAWEVVDARTNRQTR